MDDLASWVRAHAANAGGSGQALQRALMRSDPAAYERFRYLVLLRCLCRRLKQPEASVRALLRQELLGEIARGAAAAHDGGPDEVEPDDIDERLNLGPADMVQYAIDRLDDADTWDRLARAQPDRPVGWTAMHVALRVLDRLRPHGRDASGAAQDRAHHVVADRLEALREAQHAAWGEVSELAGAYDRVIDAIRARLAEESGSEGVSYALRKLFPYHAWSLVRPDDPLPAWLHARLAALWSNVPPPSAPRPLREGLDALADHHMRGDTFPSWGEVAEWTREGHVAVNTLQRRVSRLDQDVRGVLEGALVALRAKHGGD